MLKKISGLNTADFFLCPLQSDRKFHYFFAGFKFIPIYLFYKYFF
jgi:hypothetical protein